MKKKPIQLVLYIEQDEDGVYIGSVPALPACHAQGNTQKEMLQNLSEVIDLCLRVHKFDGLTDFFLHASPEEKKRVFTEAARRANEDQRALMKK